MANFDAEEPKDHRTCYEAEVLRECIFQLDREGSCRIGPEDIYHGWVDDVNAVEEHIYYCAGDEGVSAMARISNL